MSFSSDLVPSLSVTALLQQREVVRLALVETAKAAQTIGEIMEVMNRGARRSINYHGAGDLLCKREYAHALTIGNDDGVTRGMREFDAVAWQYLLRESGLLSFMDAMERERWDKAILKREIPELTSANIESTFSALYAERGAMFERGVLACFKRLSWCYKTNLPEKFGDKIVLPRLVSTLMHENCDVVDDLLRVLHVLDGKPAPDCRRGTFQEFLAAGLTYPGNRGAIKTEYLDIQVFKNGNAHVSFKRRDLVDKMNKIIAGAFPGALPSPARRWRC